MRYQDCLHIIRQLNEQFRHYKSIESLFELDQWSMLPTEGAAYRQQTAAFIGEQKNALYCGDDARRAADFLAGVKPEDMDNDIDRALVRTFGARYRNAVHMPVDLLREYNLIKAGCMNAWKQAREAKDYEIFRPWLARAFDLKKQIALSINPDAPAFETLVGMTDEGLQVSTVSEQFDRLKTGLRSLLDRLQAGHAPEVVPMPACDPEQMEQLAQRLARELGYSSTRGSFNNRVVHAFTSFMGPRDARISTYRNGSHNLIFTYLHEAGHAMYAAGSRQEIVDAGLWGGVEGGFHEANARFFENMVGHSRAYWQYYYPQLQEALAPFRDIPLDAFYAATHRVQPTLRRISSDEVTYSLHAILRFELERDYFAGVLSADDMAQAWNDKYETYLGVRPQNDTEGVLQDMHWAGDYIGYFQSYALGNIYTGQILQAMEKDIPDMEARMERGELGAIYDWMQDKIWQHGCCYMAGELMHRLTGTGLDAQPFLTYLERTYGTLYGIA